MKKTITVPPKEEHFINGRYYRAGDKYEIEEKKVKEKDNGKDTVN